jgi:hypothetical protein
MEQPASQSLGPAPAAPLELAFVLAPWQSPQHVELAETLRAEVEGAGIRASVCTGVFPPPREGLVYVLVSPREYFTLTHGRPGPPPEALRRTVFVCDEAPGSAWFEENLRLASRAGAIFDVSLQAVRQFARASVLARHLQLGWTKRWATDPAGERDIDVLFVGHISDRRATALARYARVLWRKRVHYLLPEHPPPLAERQRVGWDAGGLGPSAAECQALMGRAKVLLNIHEDSTAPALDWAHVTQAMLAGAVVVSEPSSDEHPLLPEQHFQAGAIDSLGLLALMLVDDDVRRHAIQQRAVRFLREEMPLAAAVSKLLETAAELERTEPVPNAGDPFFTAPLQSRAGEMAPARRELASPSEVSAARIRRAIKSVLLEMSELRRQVEYTECHLTMGHPPPRLELVARSRAYDAARPRVSVLMALYNYEDHVVAALDSLYASRFAAWEVIVVDDGSSDRSLSRVRSWVDRHGEVPALLLRHPVNCGLGATRNDALAWARGEYCFVLDADNEVYPHCLERLVDALEADPSAAFAYGILERFRGGEPIGLLGTLPWDPQRLRLGNYIDAMAMMRTPVVRDEFDGYARDRRLHGIEDFDLWCRLAEHGRHAVYVPEIIARYRTTDHSMQAVGNISGTDSFSLVIERSPTLMAGVLPPL